jgi:uncharacterized protein (DUF2062 family)
VQTDGKPNSIPQPATNFAHRIIQPVLNLLRQGMTPEKVALTIALGVTLGVTPIFGLASILCFLAAILLRLNGPAIQLVNYLVYPLQFVLLIPFIRLGEWIFAARPTKISVAELLRLLQHNDQTGLAALWTLTLHALVAWVALGSLAAVILYFLLIPMLRRIRQFPLPPQKLDHKLSKLSSSP